MSPRHASVLVSSALGVLLAAGASYRLGREPTVAAAPCEAASEESRPGLDPELRALFEAKYAGIPADELAQWLEPLYAQMETLSDAAVERRIADGEFTLYPSTSSELPPLKPPGMRISAGLLTVSGPPEARMVRHVVVPEGYDAELDLMRDEYSWLAERCGLDVGHDTLARSPH